MEIISAERSHIPQIQSLARQIWPVAYGDILGAGQINYMLDLFYSTKALEDQMENDQVFFLAKDAGDYTGMASWQMIRRDVAKLQKLYVLPSLQGKSIGKKLLNHVIETAREKGALSIELNVNRFNPAIEFYKKFGFIILRSEDIDIANGYFMNDHVMGLTL